MSLLNNDFIAFDGTPITGRVPTQIIVYADEGYEMSEGLRGMVAHAYKLFCDSVKVSAIPDGYHVQNRELADGSKARMESNNGVHRVMVWPVGSEVDEDLWKQGTFFCIPYDESYLIDTPETKVQTTWAIKRWKNADKEGFTHPLNKLKETKLTMFPGDKDSHPGNQTWYAHIPGAEKPHEHADYVLSWWGQLRRYVDEAVYVESAFDYRPEQHYAQGGWGLNRRNDGYPNFYSDPAREIYIPNELCGKPPGVDYGDADNYGEYEGTTEPGGNGTKYAWLNGMRFKTPAKVHSMAISKRRMPGIDKPVSVVRVLALEMMASKVVVYEAPLKKVLAAVLEGREEIKDWKTYESGSIDSALPAGWEMWATKHPAYWNADGTRCTGIYRPRLEIYPGPPMAVHAYSEGCAITFSLDDVSETVSVVVEENTTFSGSHTADSDDNSDTQTPSENHAISTTDGYATNSANMSGSMPLACDYAGNELVMLRYEIEGTANRNYTYETYSETNRESWNKTFTTAMRVKGSWTIYHDDGTKTTTNFDVTLPDRVSDTRTAGMSMYKNRGDHKSTYNGSFTTRLKLSNEVVGSDTKTITAAGKIKWNKSQRWELNWVAGEGASTFGGSKGRVIQPEEVRNETLPPELYQAWENSYYGAGSLGKSVSFQYITSHLDRVDSYTGYDDEQRKEVETNISGYNYRYEILSGDLRTKVFTVAKYNTNISLLYSPQFYCDGEGIMAGSAKVAFVTRNWQPAYETVTRSHFWGSPDCTDGYFWTHNHPATGTYPQPEETKDWTEGSGSGLSASGETGVWLFNNGTFTLEAPHSFNFREREWPISAPHPVGTQTVGWHRNGADLEWSAGWFDPTWTPHHRVPDNETDNPMGGMLADGGAGDIKTVFAASASSPDGKQTYVHLETALGPDPTGFSPSGVAPLKFVHYEQWFVNGAPVPVEKPYPQTGARSGLSSPVFVGPLPPKKVTK